MTHETNIILEGPDKCGKTTLAQAIVAKFGAVYLRVSHPGMRDFVHNVYVNSKGPHPIVMDRGWVSEEVYGPVLRGGANARLLAKIRQVQESIRPKSTYLFLIRDFQEAFEAQKGDLEHPYSKRVFKKIYHGYEKSIADMQSDLVYQHNVQVHRWSKTLDIDAILSAL